MTCRFCSHSRVATPQDSQEAKLLPDEVASANGHASDLATHSNVVLDSEDEDYPDQTDSTIQIPRAANLNDQDHCTSHDYCEHRGTSERPALQVRFQSRVRIAAGIGRRLRRFSDGLPSNASSISESTSSSSISVPLRTPDSEGTRGWAPLGRRISQLASRADAVHGNTTRGRCRVNENGSIRNKSRSLSFPDSENERTRLVSFYNGYSYTTNAHRHSQEAWRKQVADVTFGKWPWRLFNRHWWWWKVEPILCCFYICEDPADGET